MSYILIWYQISIQNNIQSVSNIFQIHLLCSWNTETYVCISPDFFLNVEIQSKFLVCSKQNVYYYFSRIIVDFIRPDCVYGECSKSVLCTLFNILVRSTYDRAVP